MQSKRILLASVIGNWVEWYNFLLFIYLEPVMAKLFFPMANRVVALTLVFTLFAAGFIARPFGSMLFGYIGDRYGRQRALVWSVGALAAAACFMALMPTYATIGIVSPILVSLVRILQGLSAGGEHMGSAVYLMESAPPHRKALWVSLAPVTAAVGILSGSCAAFLLTNNMPMEKILAWGWRIPFVIGAIISLYSIKLRLSLPETPLFKNLQLQQKTNMPIFYQLLGNFRELKKFLSVIALTVTWAVFYNVLYVWLPSSLGLRINNYSMSLLAILLLAFGYLADKVKSIYLILVASAALLLLAYPLFTLIASGNIYYIYFAMSVFTVFVSMYMIGTLITMLELFSGEVRYTGASLSFNIGLAVFGGTAPLIANTLINFFHNPLAPVYYLMLSAALALFMGFRWRV